MQPHRTCWSHVAALVATVRAFIYHLFAVYHTAKIYKWLANGWLAELVKANDIVEPRVMEVGPGTGEGTGLLAPTFAKLKARYHGVELDSSYAARLVKQPWFDPKTMKVSLTDFLTIPAEVFKTVDVLLMIECLMLIDEAAVTRQLAIARAANPKLAIVMAHVEFETHTAWNRFRTAVAHRIKPYCYWFTTIHFGRPIVRDKFLQLVTAFSTRHGFITPINDHTNRGHPGITIDHNIFGCPLRVYALL